MDIPTPTDAECDILNVLWERGPSTVREVYDAITRVKDVGYTTVLKQMQVMHGKGLLTRSERFRSHVYAAAQKQAHVRRQLAAAVMQRAFGGSAHQLLQSALAGRTITPEELTEIRTLLSRYDGRKK
jgi:predicted transcriptional regulator